MPQPMDKIEAAAISPDLADRDIAESAGSVRGLRAVDRRDLWLMRAFQGRMTGGVLRRLVDPQRVLTDGMSFWSAQVVLTAVEFDLFTLLTAGPLTEQALGERLGWHSRARGPFLNTLVEMGLLRRGRGGVYANTRRAALFLDKAQASYIGGILELSNKRLYSLWSGLPDLLRTGAPEAVEERGDNEFFSTLYRDPEALREFLSGMTGIATGEAMMIAARFPWRRFRTFVDVGAAQGALPVRVALTHPHLTGASYDLAAVEPIFQEYIASFGLADRIRFIPGDMHSGELPAAEVISFGHVLHGYGETTRRTLITKAYDTLPPGGALLIYDAMINPRRRRNLIRSLSSLNIMLETREGFEATTTQCATWLREAGFTRVKHRHLIGPTSMVFGTKPGRLGDRRP
ncbi:methyltransferase family protein [Nocardia mexicana]|uniref:Methyltransferase family protein n=1 Tax=Nocardia mexicana TaxID=279262 RepID=A0A370H5G6_9NOCA|nr:methyltransferase family protein [Nocardia mexicana]